MQEFGYLQMGAEDVQVGDRAIRALPNSSREIFLAILENGPMTHSDLRQVTGMPARTIRYGIRRLKEDGMVDSRCSLRDTRICYFFVHPDRLDPTSIERRRAEASQSTHYVVRAQPDRPAPLVRR